MLYLPDRRYLARFETLSWPLPPKLLPWLFNRGLAIYVLPNDEEKALKLLSRVVRRRVLADTPLEGDTRLAHKTAHFIPKENCIIIPHKTFFRERGENVILHEVAHAVDFNYLGIGNGVISSYPSVWDALRVKKQLNSYCEAKLKETGLQLEQFACSFVAFFQEPDENKPGTSTIDDLSPELIQFFKTNIMDHFK